MSCATQKLKIIIIYHCVAVLVKKFIYGIRNFCLERLINFNATDFNNELGKTKKSHLRIFISTEPFHYVLFSSLLNGINT